MMMTLSGTQFTYPRRGFSASFSTLDAIRGVVHAVDNFFGKYVLPKRRDEFSVCTQQQKNKRERVADVNGEWSEERELV
jgi:hypothetical protein